MGEKLTSFERELTDLGIPLGSVFILELRFGVRNWLQLASLAPETLGLVPGMTPSRVELVRLAASTRGEPHGLEGRSPRAAAG